MTDRKELEALFEARGYTDFTWINTEDIVVAQWVRVNYPPMNRESLSLTSSDVAIANDVDR